MAEICRVCLGTSGSFTNIFDDAQKRDPCIADMIAECTGCAVERGNLLPENICPPCLEDAVSAFNLKKTCERLKEKSKEESISDKLEDEEQSENSEQLKSQGDEDVDHRFKSSLDNHKNVQTAAQPYKCSHCPKSFKRKFVLSQHTRIHTGERPYKCTHCSKSFAQSATLRNHIRLHTGERPYQCSHCSMSFKQRSALDNHLKRKKNQIVLPPSSPNAMQS